MSAVSDSVEDLHPITSVMKEKLGYEPGKTCEEGGKGNLVNAGVAPDADANEKKQTTKPPRRTGSNESLSASSTHLEVEEVAERIAALSPWAAKADAEAGWGTGHPHYPISASFAASRT